MIHHGNSQAREKVECVRKKLIVWSQQKPAVNSLASPAYPNHNHEKKGDSLISFRCSVLGA